MSKEVIVFVLVRDQQIGSQAYLSARALAKALGKISIEGMYANNIKVAKAIFNADEELLKSVVLTTNVGNETAKTKDLLRVIELLDTSTEFLELANQLRPRCLTLVGSSNYEKIKSVHNE